MHVKFADVAVRDLEVQKAVMNVLTSGQFINGPAVAQFAERWAETCNTKHCVPVASGSAALVASLRMLQKHKPTHREKPIVVVPDYSFAATVFSVLEADCTPVYCGVDYDGLLDLRLLEDVLFNELVWGVVPVHLYGQLLNFVDTKLNNPQLVFVEDACQAHGTFRGVTGDVACFSFYPAKNLGAAGDAGAVVTDDSTLAQLVRTYINYGDEPGKKYSHQFPGSNMRMDTLQAAVLLTKLNEDRLAAANARRALNAMVYKKHGIETFADRQPNAYHQYPIVVENPEAFIAVLRAKEIDVLRHYPHTLPEVFKAKAYIGLMDHATFYARHAVSLPIADHLNTPQIEYVADTILELCTRDMSMWRLKNAH